MRARREASPPPQIAGYEYVRLLGLGGFADVFEYQQELPRRTVAVKVLLASSLDVQTRTRFFAEANVMAQLSHHPSIVTIYQADIAPDGRPFLVMENCSRAGLGSRYRTERISVEETLRTGIRLASAVEAAHQLGILHRDIKPANILTTDYGWPALTDFGIAATTGGEGSAGTGMSIPWSPPELLAEHPVGDQRGDVYSLAATVYSMLAGRSPFEVIGQPNGPADLISRIERSPLTRIDRDDVPPGLEAVLARAMSKDPARRYDSALSIARALQQVERSLGITQTAIDLSAELIEQTIPRPATSLEEGSTRLRPIVSIDPALPAVAPKQEDVDHDATRLRPILSVSPEAPPAPDSRHAQAPAPSSPPYAGPSAPGVPSPGNSPLGYVVPPPLPGGRALGPSVPTGQQPAEGLIPGTQRRRKNVLGLTAAAVIVIGGVATAAIVAGQRDTGPVPQPTSTVSTPPPTLNTGAVPAPTDIVGTRVRADAVRFTWVNPDPQDGDRFLWTEVGVGVSPSPVLVDESVIEVPAPADDTQVCIEVSIVREDRRASTQPAQGCSS